MRKHCPVPGNAVRPAATSTTQLTIRGEEFKTDDGHGRRILFFFFFRSLCQSLHPFAQHFKDENRFHRQPFAIICVISYEGKDNQYII